ncbi:hypothetical protein JL720_11431 [Aureococcus anophagefferens]|nr:hypothetical protein JL720_11431 [Aureococcus anophagefferens]
MTSALLLALLPSAGAFGPAPRRRAATRVAAAEAPSMDEDWTDSQWSMYASQSGRWEGVWTTFNDQGIETMSHEGVWDVQLVPCPDGSEGDAAVHKLEVERPADGDDTHFWRGVNPWAWRRIWGGDAAVATGRESLQRFLLAPQVVQSSVPAPMRVAWMPNGDELRAEAVVVALEPTDDDRRFLPPKLVTFRADALVNKGAKPTDPTYVDPPEEFDNAA